jgi:hypothetical protein
VIDYQAGLVIGFNAVPDSPGSVVNWSADCAGGVVTMTADRTCTPVFVTAGPPPPPPPPPPGLALLTIVVNGNGTVLGPGIVCGAGGATCSTQFPTGATIGLGVLPVDGHQFSGWSGAGCGPLVTMSVNRTCTATFVPAVDLLERPPAEER